MFVAFPNEYVGAVIGKGRRIFAVSEFHQPDAPKDSAITAFTRNTTSKVCWAEGLRLGDVSGPGPQLPLASQQQA